MSQVVIKTDGKVKTNQSISKVIKNPLYDYSSYTYNFTLAAVSKSDASDPEKYMSKSLDFIILKTGGKGLDSIKAAKAADIIVKRQEDINGNTLVEGGVDTTTSKKMVQSFNENSPGRFDMFIENVEINSIIAPNEISGVSTAQGFSFDVIEPYSINGFIEALQVSAVAAGYPTYNTASYVLKMEFKGYPSTPLSSAETIPNSTRYFVIKFQTLDVEVTERGTKYRCRAVPWNEGAFGIPNDIKYSGSMNGNTIKDLLEDFCKKLNNMIAYDDKTSKTDKLIGNNSDRYFVKFPSWNNGRLDFNKVNKIGTSTHVEKNDNVSSSYNDPGNIGQGVKNAYKVEGATVQGKESPETSRSQVQFREGQKVHEVMTSVIRDSEYIKKILINPKENINELGLMDYFLIDVEVKNRVEIDPVSRKPFQDFTYIIIPYKVHISRIPIYAGQEFDVTSYTKVILKEYNYLYTGSNNDVLNFKLNFNHLYYEAIPKALGDNDLPNARSVAEVDQKVDRKIANSNLENYKISVTGAPRIGTSDVPTTVQQLGGNGRQPSTDPYLVLARNLHESIVNSKASLISGEIEIVGDPFYLVQSGIGRNSKSNANNDSERITESGDANYLYGEVAIVIQFKNPIDIKTESLAASGSYQFKEELVPFSGIYRVNEVRSTFSEGTFKQRLKISRLAGQIISNIQPTDIAQVITTEVVPPGK